ncbi:hypothetical protein SCP_0310390 [Sparassis crispa]|uniref:HAT C-terminal dimerisation domain-containing protein n=1 Tax=Sparassis crispa TaxID=139825 RepID=A0A401GGM2_9APHY|nr:hypothetical protein SCP_0310390 [Sparassis crispa]GBE81312.1 hypothetical protein SCP_0310390 [Sparassis crispa]
MKLGKATMNRYYSKTDLSNVYRITMVLHPGLKLEYFCQHAWEADWIEEAKRLTHEEYHKHYEKNTDGTQGDAHNEAVPSDDEFGDFANISVTMEPSARNELEEYLAAPLEKVRDPLRWWWDSRKAYPHLHRMALNYLSVPATSTAVERAFSQGRQLLHFTRNRLSPKSIRAALCLGSWGRSELLHIADLIAAVNTKKCKWAVVEEEVDEQA